MVISLKSIAIVAMTAGLTGAALNAAMVAGEKTRALSNRVGTDKLIYIDDERALVCPKQINSRTYCTTLDGTQSMKPQLRD